MVKIKKVNFVLKTYFQMNKQKVTEIHTLIYGVIHFLNIKKGK